MIENLLVDLMAISLVDFRRQSAVRIDRGEMVNVLLKLFLPITICPRKIRCPIYSESLKFAFKRRCRKTDFVSEDLYHPQSKIFLQIFIYPRCMAIKNLSGGDWLELRRTFQSRCARRSDYFRNKRNCLRRFIPIIYHRSVTEARTFLSLFPDRAGIAYDAFYFARALADIRYRRPFREINVLPQVLQQDFIDFLLRFLFV